MRSWIYIILLGFAWALPAEAQDAAPRTPNSEPRTDELAKVEGSPITASQFRASYAEYLVRTGQKDAARTREAILQQMINDRLVVLDSRKSGIEHSEAYRVNLKLTRDKILIETYLEREILNAIEITEDDVEKAFERINTTISARHLYARTLEEANVLYERLASGESFEKLAREVFVDSALAHSGGDIGEFTFDELDPDFEDAAFAMKAGEVSKPVRTAQGYSIIQVTDRFTKPILTEAEYAARKPRLQQFVLSKEIAQARSHFVRNLSSDLNLRFNHKTFDRLLGQITGTGLIESFETFLSEPLVSFRGKTWTVDDFRARAGETDPRQRAAVRTEADLKEFITALAVRSVLLDRAQAYAGDPEVSDALAGAMDEWILDRKKQELTSTPILEDSARAQFDRDPAEFTDKDGKPLDYEQARPLIVEQLRFAEARRATLALVAELRKKYQVEVNRDALHAVRIAGNTFADVGTSPSMNLR